jgi:hypothetical protein
MALLFARFPPICDSGVLFPRGFAVHEFSRGRRPVADLHRGEHFGKVQQRADAVVETDVEQHGRAHVIEVRIPSELPELLGHFAQLKAKHGARKALGPAGIDVATIADGEFADGVAVCLGAEALLGRKPRKGEIGGAHGLPFRWLLRTA